MRGVGAPSRSLTNPLLACSLISGSILLVLGLVVLVGWQTGNRTLVQIAPSFVPMQFNTALGFVFCGASLWLHGFQRNRWATVAGGLVGLLGVLTLVQYLCEVSLGIDELFMKHDVTVGTSHPGRMAPNTAICFALAGSCAVVLSSGWTPSRRSILAAVLASLTLGLGVVAFVGYFTNLESAYGWGGWTRMALHTSLGFIIASLGFLSLAWRSDVEDESWIPRWMPAPVAIAVLTTTFCFWQAMIIEGARIQRQYEEFSSLNNLATVMLVVGAVLALALALVVYLAQKAGRRSRDILRANLALQEEIATRQAAERALQSHRDELEHIVAQRTQELDRARLEAESANRAKSDFLSHMSHELRTPLNGILGYAQILQRNPTTQRTQIGSLNGIVDCGDHLLALINDVLDLSKIEAGRIEIDATAFNLRDLLQGVCRIVKGRAERKGIEFLTDIASDAPQGIYSDAAKLRQILVNLLGNAVKFTEEGRVILRVKTRSPDLLQIDVVDTGVGISENEIDAIFDPFKQVEAGKAAGGTGLGLAISKRLAEALDAAIEVESEKGNGSTFTVTLPLLEAPVEDRSQTTDTHVAGKNPRLAENQACTILVADDRETNRRVLQGMLEDSGFRTVLACDGQEALDRLGDHHDIQLVLMDVRMPRMDGLEALVRIRANPKLRHLPVVAVTASVFPEFRKKAIESGFDDFLGKPFRVEDLFGLLRRLLDIEFIERDCDPGPTSSEDPAPTAVAWEIVPRDTRERLRDALRIKNLTAIKAIAQELSSAPATEAIGANIAEMVQAFDFQGMLELANELELSDGPE